MGPDMVGSFYDRLYAERVKNWPSEQVISFVERYRPQLVGTRVLDVGCGCGRHSIYMARRGLRVAGVDLSPVAIDYARAWARREGLDARFEIGDSRTLPFADESFQGLISWEAMFYGDGATVQSSIDESLRVLQPGGHFLVLLKSKDDFRFRDFRRLDENTCESEQGLLMTCHSREEVERAFARQASNLNIEVLAYSLNNGAQLVSNFMVSGQKADERG